MRIADTAPCIQEDEGGHPTKPEQVHLLPVQLGHGVVWVGQARIGKPFLLPIRANGVRPLRADGQYSGAIALEPVILLTQLRQMLTAVRSSEPPVEDQQDRGAPQGGEPHRFAGGINQAKVGRLRAQRLFCDGDHPPFGVTSPY